MIPYRGQENGIEILLITSRGRGRWIIPKGVIDPGRTATESARNEAYEEAGVEGEVNSVALGQYQYEKWGGICTVEVFAMEVSTVSETWPESSERRRKWMSVEEAANAVEESALKGLILSLSSAKPPSPSQ